MPQSIRHLFRGSELKKTGGTAAPSVRSTAPHPFERLPAAALRESPGHHNPLWKRTTRQQATGRIVAPQAVVCRSVQRSAFILGARSGPGGCVVRAGAGCRLGRPSGGVNLRPQVQSSLRGVAGQAPLRWRLKNPRENGRLRGPSTGLRRVTLHRRGTPRPGRCRQQRSGRLRGRRSHRTRARRSAW